METRWWDFYISIFSHNTKFQAIRLMCLRPLWFTINPYVRAVLVIIWNNWYWIKYNIKNTRERYLSIFAGYFIKYQATCLSFIEAYLLQICLHNILIVRFDIVKTRQIYYKFLREAPRPDLLEFQSTTSKYYVLI